MKRISFIKFLSLLCLLLFARNVQGQTKASNIVYQDKEVRITLITDGVVRLEWEPGGKFVDNASFIAVNRETSPVNCKVKNSGKAIEVQTSKMIVKS